MDCFSAFFWITLVILGIIRLIQWIGEKTLESNIRIAKETKDYAEYNRLSAIRDERQKRVQQAARGSADNQRYFDRIMVLDAAADGVFVPGGERVFDDEPEQDDRGDYDDEVPYQDEYYDNYEDYGYPEDYEENDR